MWWYFIICKMVLPSTGEKADTLSLAAVICESRVNATSCNGLTHDSPGFDSWWEQRKNQASRPSQGTVKGCAVFK